jgi:DNA repair protein RadC
MVLRRFPVDFVLSGNNLKSIPKNLRPREKAKRQGIDSLSNVELLALILNQGIRGKSVLELASELLGFKGWAFLTSPASVTRMIKGLHDAQWLKILALGEIAKRFQNEQSTNHTLVKDPAEVFELFRHRFKGLLQERLLLVGLSSKNHIIFEKIISFGSEQSVYLESNDIFHELIRHQSKRFILIHNHPSGIVKPSEQDIQTTYTLKEQSKKIGLVLLDHIIIGEDQYYSMAKHFG